MKLPPGEDPRVWMEPMALGGLEPGGPDGDSWVVLDTRGGGWRLRVQDEAGVVHEVDVPRARTNGEREDIVWLAVSFLQPLEIGIAPEAKGSELRVDSPPVASSPSTIRTSPPVSPTAGSAEAPDLPPTADAVLADAAQSGRETGGVVGTGEAPSTEEQPEVVEELDSEDLDLGVRGGGEVLELHRAWRPWAEVGGLGALRARVERGAAVQAMVGLATRGGWEVGLGVRLANSTAIEWGDTRSVRCRDLQVGVWRPLRQLSIRPGVVAGVSLRRFAQDGVEPRDRLVPALGPSVGIPIRVAGSVRVEPWVGAQIDLARTRFYLYDTLVGSFSPLAVLGGVTLRLGGPPGAAASSYGVPPGTNPGGFNTTVDQIEFVRALPGR